MSQEEAGGASTAQPAAPARDEQIRAILRTEPGASDRGIAKRVRCHYSVVRKQRHKMQLAGELPSAASAVGGTGAPEPAGEPVRLDTLVEDPECTVRFALSEPHVRSLMALLEAGSASVDPILVYRITLGPLHGQLVRVDGAHRVAAAQRLGWDTIAARIVEGTLDEARDAAAQANAKARQLPLTDAEKRQALLTMHLRHPDWTPSQLKKRLDWGRTPEAIGYIVQAEDMRRALRERGLGAGKAKNLAEATLRAIRPAPPGYWLALAGLAVARQWTGAQVTEVVNALFGPGWTGSPAQCQRATAALDLLEEDAALTLDEALAPPAVADAITAPVEPEPVVAAEVGTAEEDAAAAQARTGLSRPTPEDWTAPQTTAEPPPVLTQPEAPAAEETDEDRRARERQTAAAAYRDEMGRLAEALERMAIDREDFAVEATDEEVQQLHRLAFDLGQQAEYVSAAVQTRQQQAAS